MQRCIVCGKPHGKGLARITDHHFFWPKKHFKKKRRDCKQFVQKVCAGCHNQGYDNYHGHFVHHHCGEVCKDPTCKFAIICYKFYELF